MTKTAMFACRDPRGAHWQLGPLPYASGRMMLIGWRQTPAPADAGVPDNIAAVLARALTAVARVTFPTSCKTVVPLGEWVPLDGDLARRVGDDGLMGRVSSIVSDVPSAIDLLSTLRPETAAQAFDDAGFPWWLQGQVLILSSARSAAPDIDHATLLSLLTDGWPKRAMELEKHGILGVVRPGVDGDVAGVFSLTIAFETLLLATLERESSRAGFHWMELTEADFSEQLAVK